MRRWIHCLKGAVLTPACRDRRKSPASRRDAGGARAMLAAVARA